MGEEGWGKIYIIYKKKAKANELQFVLYFFKFAMIDGTFCHIKADVRVNKYL